MKRKNWLLSMVTLCCLVCIQPAAWALQLRVVTENWPPLSFLEEGEPQGMAVEIVEEILNRVRIPAKIQVIPWDVGWDLASTDPNVVLFSMVYTEERAQQFKMIGAIAVGETKFYARKGSGMTLASLEDAKSVAKIGTYRETYEEQFLRNNGFSNLDVSDNPVEAAQKLLSGETDLWINVAPGTGPILKEAGYAPEDVEDVLTISQELFYIAFSEATPDATVDMWKEKLEAMKRDGTFTRIYRAWFPGQTPPSEILEMQSK